MLSGCHRMLHFCFVLMAENSTLKSTEFIVKQLGFRINMVERHAYEFAN